jgi:hypothetical protein
VSLSNKLESHITIFLVTFSNLEVSTILGAIHYIDRDKAIKRDEIKELASRKAGIKFIITNGETEVEWKLSEKLKNHFNDKL